MFAFAQFLPALRMLVVGAVHGLAGSGALTALLVATIPSVGARLIYLALFGIGSTLGMAALSGVLPRLPEAPWPGCDSAQIRPP